MVTAGSDIIKMTNMSEIFVGKTKSYTLDSVSAF
jgi:hypothetical protein